MQSSTWCVPSSAVFAIFCRQELTGFVPAQPDDFYAPLIHLYFNDDLTEA